MNGRWFPTSSRRYSRNGKAITQAAHLLVAMASSARLTATATNIMAASQIIALSAFDEIKKLAEKRKDLGKLKLPEATTITDEVRNRVKQLTTGNPPAQA